MYQWGLTGTVYCSVDWCEKTQKEQKSILEMDKRDWKSLIGWLAFIAEAAQSSAAKAEPDHKGRHESGLYGL